MNLPIKYHLTQKSSTNWQPNTQCYCSMPFAS